MSKAVSEGLQRLARHFADDPGLVATAGRVALLMDAATLLEIKPDIWRVQNEFLQAYGELADRGAVDEPLRKTFVNLAVRLQVSPSMLGWRP